MALCTTLLTLSALTRFADRLNAGMRSQRFAIVADNGVVQHIAIDDGSIDLDATSAESILAFLKSPAAKAAKKGPPPAKAKTSTAAKSTAAASTTDDDDSNASAALLLAVPLLAAAAYYYSENPM